MKTGRPFSWLTTCLILIHGLMLGCPVCSYGQVPRGQSYWVYFSGKDGANFNPYHFFDPKAIERRLRHGEDLFDSLDFPVNENYLAGLDKVVDSMDVISRWLNAVCVYATLQQVEAIERLPFVDRVESACATMITASYEQESRYLDSLSGEQLKLLRFQTSHMKGNYFQEQGIDGLGVRIAIFDAGFRGLDVCPAFSDIIEEGRILATWDFFRNSPDVFHGNEHGTMVTSLIGGLADSIPMGLAPCADFLLARTETWRESYVEEKYWLAAAEWADRLGADIINSSLGYTYNRYFPEEMDGNTSLVSRAAAIAFQKGILIVNAAGNSGEDPSWKAMASPADAPSVVAVGALDYPSLLKASYSSKGPAADGRIKPDISALGNVYVATVKGYIRNEGTSFASPLVAGFAACVIQLHPEWTNRQVFDALLRSGDLFPYYDYSHGYGIPQADYFFRDTLQESLPTFAFTVTETQVKVVICDTNRVAMERILSHPYVYYHICNEYGEIEQYFVIRANIREALTFDVSEFAPGKKVCIHLAGYTSSRTF